MILIVTWFDDLYVSCQHLVHFDVWWHCEAGVCVHNQCFQGPLSNL